MTDTITVRRATVDDVELIAPLFDAYRQFYRANADLSLARTFLRERLEKNESIIFIALLADGTATGFTQLYPTFSSVSMAPILTLNDLFVSQAARRLGVGKALLNAAADYGRANGAVRLSLRTENHNITAQALYEQEGWKRETQFYSYDLSLGG
jgi:GNAT superfamily N-acetyltransferase